MQNARVLAGSAPKACDRDPRSQVLGREDLQKRRRQGERAQQGRNSVETPIEYLKREIRKRKGKGQWR